MFYAILKACLTAIELEQNRLPAIQGKPLSDYQVALNQAAGTIKRLMQFN